MWNANSSAWRPTSPKHTERIVVQAGILSEGFLLDFADAFGRTRLPPPSRSNRATSFGTPGRIAPSVREMRHRRNGRPSFHRAPKSFARRRVSSPEQHPSDPGAALRTARRHTFAAALQSHTLRASDRQDGSTADPPSRTRHVGSVSTSGTEIAKRRARDIWKRGAPGGNCRPRRPWVADLAVCFQRSTVRGRTYRPPGPHSAPALRRSRRRSRRPGALSDRLRETSRSHCRSNRRPAFHARSSRPNSAARLGDLRTYAGRRSCFNSYDSHRDT